MTTRVFFALAVLLSVATMGAVAAGTNPAGEYSKHFDALSKLSIAVAEAMPLEQYDFRPHADSMTFGQLMVHIATTNYQFCAGLKDSDPPALPDSLKNPSAMPAKQGIVKVLTDSFTFCSDVISNLTDEQLNAVHSSPDGRLPGREVLLAMFVHVAHHRGQAEIYLRDKGIKPPPYRV